MLLWIPELEAKRICEVAGVDLPLENSDVYLTTASRWSSIPPVVEHTRRGFTIWAARGEDLKPFINHNGCHHSIPGHITWVHSEQGVSDKHAGLCKFCEQLVLWESDSYRP